jgi:hypothetical protein
MAFLNHPMTGVPEDSDPGARLRKRRTLFRLCLLLVLSLLLHAALLDRLPLIPHWTEVTPPPIEATIVDTPPPAPIALPAPITPLKPLPTHRATPLAPLSLPPPPDVIATRDVDGPGLSLGPADTGPRGGPSPEAGASPPQAPLAQPVVPSPSPPAPPATAPVNETLNYDVIALDPKKPDQSLVGHGVLTYRSDNGVYHATLEARVALLFISLTVLSSDSEGSVGSDGLEPTRYSETPRNKPTMITTIARDANGVPGAVTYSQGGDQPMAMPGVEDRLSVLFQVGGLMSANASLRDPYARFAVPVAGLKGNVETWNFLVSGHDAVVTPDGKQDAIHISRVLRPGTNDRGIEVWIGTAPLGVPLRLRYTEPGGATIDLTLASKG